MDTIDLAASSVDSNLLAKETIMAEMDNLVLFLSSSGSSPGNSS